MAVQDKIADEKLTDDELDKVAGGWFWQGYNEDQMKNAGVTWIHNNFSADEFSFKGKSITSKEVEAVTVYFLAYKKQADDNMEEVSKWFSEFKKGSYYRHLCHSKMSGTFM